MSVFLQHFRHYRFIRMLFYAVHYKKINNTTVKIFVVFSQQPSSQDLCVNIAHIRSKTFHCIRKYIKFVKVSFEVLIKWYMCFPWVRQTQSLSFFLGLLKFMAKRGAGFAWVWDFFHAHNLLCMLLYLKPS